MIPGGDILLDCRTSLLGKHGTAGEACSEQAYKVVKLLTRLSADYFPPAIIRKMKTRGGTPDGLQVCWVRFPE